jgi:DNA-binding response OmpR family regulator
MRILIADDDPVSRRLLERTLQRLGHEVVVVSEGTAARDALLDPAGPRLAILDWMMPGLDGLAVCHAVRQREAPYVYLIMLTARDSDADVVAGLVAEADDYLTKPFDALELNARIQSGERIIDLQTRLLNAERDLRYQATHDRLTGLWNRGMILDHLARSVKRADRSDEPLTAAAAAPTSRTATPTSSTTRSPGCCSPTPTTPWSIPVTTTEVA